MESIPQLCLIFPLFNKTINSCSRGYKTKILILTRWTLIASHSLLQTLSSFSQIFILFFIPIKLVKHLPSRKIALLAKQASLRKVHLRKEQSSMNANENFALFALELTTKTTLTISLGTRTGTAITARAIASVQDAKDRTLLRS